MYILYISGVDWEMKRWKTTRIRMHNGSVTHTVRGIPVMPATTSLLNPARLVHDAQLHYMDSHSFPAKSRKTDWVQKLIMK